MGTSSAKAVVFTDQGEVVGEGRVRTPWITTSYGVELAAEELLNAAIGALRLAVDAIPGTTSVTAVGITSMGESGVLVDRDGTPVAPVIAWHDSRDHEEVEALRRESLQTRSPRQPGKPLRGTVGHHQASLAAAARAFSGECGSAVQHRGMGRARPGRR